MEEQIDEHIQYSFMNCYSPGQCFVRLVSFRVYLFLFILAQSFTAVQMETMCTKFPTDTCMSILSNSNVTVIKKVAKCKKKKKKNTCFAKATRSINTLLNTLCRYDHESQRYLYKT